MSSRYSFLIIFIISLLILLAAAYFQFVKGYEPCPLCIMERVAFLIVGIIALIATCHNPTRLGTWIYTVLIILFCLAGLYFAGKQVWLQHLPPDQVPACGPGLNVLIEDFPLSTILHELFFGSGQCAEVDWTFLSLSFAGWACVWFGVLILLAVWAAIRRTRFLG